MYGGCFGKDVTVKWQLGSSVEMSKIHYWTESPVRFVCIDYSATATRQNAVESGVTH